MGHWHAHAATRAGANVAAIIDPDRGRAKAIASRHGARCFGSLDEMISGAVVDAVHITSPTDTHAQIAKVALRAGLHVLVEKPLAADATETETLFTMAERSGVQIAAVHQYAWQKSVAAIARDIGRVGDPIQINIRLHSAGGANYASEDLPELAADILPHPISIFQRLLPDADLQVLDWKIDAAGQSTWRMSADFAGTALAAQISLAARPPVAELEVLGTLASFEADLFHDFRVLIPGAAGRRAKMLRPFAHSTRKVTAAAINLARRAGRREPAYPGLVALTRAFYKACLNLGEPPMTSSDVMAIARLRDDFIQKVIPNRRLAS